MVSGSPLSQDRTVNLYLRVRVVRRGPGRRAVQRDLSSVSNETVDPRPLRSGVFVLSASLLTPCYATSQNKGRRDRIPGALSPTCEHETAPTATGQDDQIATHNPSVVGSSPTCPTTSLWGLTCSDGDS